MFDDLDATLRALLDDAAAPAELRQADVSFATPGRDYAPALPTVNLFLRDIRENVELHDPVPELVEQAGGFVLRPPPLRVACSYLVTTWADPSQAAAAQVLAEHQLLGQALIWLRQFPVLPASYLQGSLAGQEIPPPVVVARPGAGADTGDYWTWSALGIAPRPSLNLSVTISMELAPAADLGPAVLTSQVDLGLTGDAAPGPDAAFQIAGTVRRGDSPAGQATVTLEPGGRLAVTDALGRFSFAGLQAGQYVLRTVSADGSSTAQPAVSVPAATAAGYDVSLPP